MPIIALPDDTLRLLGSPTVVATPVDLIKELLDNAIDAQAISAEVLVSQNLVDRIEVRDNGDGIHSSDYSSLGRAGHTSKITSFEELQTLGGATLGFRGQALASVNNLGSVTVTTRTAEDLTAVMLKLCPGVGGVESQQRTSAPVGTTVSVTGLFNSLPVRKQFALKEAQKYLVGIKHLLYSYALARPQIRLSFRVLGGSSKHSWSYAPRPGAAIREAVVQVFGAEVMSQCLIRTISSNAEEQNEQVSEKLTIEAVLPNPDSDHSRIPKGSFFSVDSRPVSTQRGTMKKLLAAFKTHISKPPGLAEGQQNSRDPFICVNIRCSPGSYDPNIEPAKTEVLFAEESRLKDLFEHLCSDVYGGQEFGDPFITTGERQSVRRTQTRTPPPSNDTPSGVESIPPGPARGLHDQVRQTDQAPLQSSSSPLRGRPEGLSSSSSAIDGLGFRDRFQQGDPPLAEPPVVPIPERKPIPNHAVLERNDHQPGQPGQQSTLPNAAYQLTSEPALAPRRRPAPHQADNRGWAVDMSEDPDMSTDEESEVLASRFRVHQETEPQEQGEGGDPREGLNPWSIAKMTASARQPVDGQALLKGLPQNVGQMQDPRALSMPDSAFDDEELPILRPHGGPPGDLDPPRTTSLGITHMADQPQQLPGFRHPCLLSLSPSISSRARNTSHVYPRPSPSKRTHNLPGLRYCHDDAAGGIEPDNLAQTRLTFKGPKGSQKNRNDQVQMHIDDVPSRSNPPFRKPRRVNAGRRGFPAVNRVENVNNHGADGIGQMGHQSLRQTSHSPSLAFGNLTARSSERSVTSPSTRSRGNENWLDGDSRKYLMRRQRSEAEHRRKGRQPPKRAKSDRLPLEKVPAKEGIQHVVLTIAPDMDKVGEMSEDTAVYDIFCADCRTELRLSDEMGLDDVTEIETRLKSVLSAWTEKMLGEKTEVVLDIRRQVKGKATTA